MADLSKLVEDLSSLTVLEASELAKLLEEKWGVSAAAPVAAAAAPGAVAAPVEEQTEFTVMLMAAGAAAETPHFSSRSFESSEASSTVRLERSSTSLLRSAILVSHLKSVWLVWLGLSRQAA